MKNLNLLFNKSYYSGLREKKDTAFDNSLKDRNREICQDRFHLDSDPAKSDYHALPEEICKHTFLMKTTYPGLLVGTGYAHETGDGSEQCVKLGFSFDYVTGQPYVPGSSVKGMLKSCFTDGTAGEVLQGIMAMGSVPSKETMEALEQNIFEGNDVFFDAVLWCGDQNGFVMAQDYITPHGEDETKNPTPLMMIKVRPGVIFEFRFQLHAFETEGLTVQAEKKLELFRELISLFGVGAKTNVGYGVLTCVTDDAAKQQREQAEADVQRALQARATPASVTARPAQPQRQAEQTRPASIGAPAAQGNDAYHPCAVTGCSGRTRFVLCRDCQEKARAEGICPLCGKNTGWNATFNNHYDLCWDCKQKYSPR